MLVNLIAAKVSWEGFKPKQVILLVILAAVPYIYGGLHIYYHEQKIQDNATFTAILVQPSFPAEEALKITDRKEYLALIIKEWHQILQITRKQVGEKADLLLLPESVLPYGTYSFVYPYAVVKKAFLEAYGQIALKALPALEYPLANPQDTAQGQIWMVNNAYWIQTLANLFDTDVVVGLEDAEDTREGIREYYSSAMHFSPQTQPGNDFKVSRYENESLYPWANISPSPLLKAWLTPMVLQVPLRMGRKLKSLMAKLKWAYRFAMKRLMAT